MRFVDWLLALHLLSAFALVGALTIFSIGFVALRSADTAGRVLALGSAIKIGKVSVAIGVVGTIVFGVWLAISLDAYQVWDLWVLLAIVGWVVATELGRRSGAAMGGAMERAKQLAAQGKDAPDAELVTAIRSSQAQTLHWAATAITLLVLVDMIWKPGA
jgi:hypothetical protein